MIMKNITTILWKSVKRCGESIPGEKLRWLKEEKSTKRI